MYHVKPSDLGTLICSVDLSLFPNLLPTNPAAKYPTDPKWPIAISSIPVIFLTYGCNNAGKITMSAPKMIDPTITNVAPFIPVVENTAEIKHAMNKV